MYTYAYVTYVMYIEGCSVYGKIRTIIYYNTY